MKLALIGLGILIMGAVGTPEEHLEEVEAWHAWRVDRLYSPTGFLSLVGLTRLQEGENSLGSSEENYLRLPDSTPAVVGTIIVEDGIVRLEGAAGKVTVDGEPIGDSLIMHPDASDRGENTTICQIGTVQFFAIDRPAGLLLRVRDSESPMLKLFDGKIERWPVDQKWQIPAKWIPYDPPRVVTFVDELGASDDQALDGYVEFEFEGETYSLVPQPIGDELFFMIADETNGDESYGAGRYFYTPKPDEDGTVILDFNKAYNPPCVFSVFGTCQFPPRDNRLPFRVTAGEKIWEGEPFGGDKN